ncbi:MAG: FAD-dependent oxidoreductase, partial [Gemmatimonadota bacterium]|nr:FAD-dependent oxidoreductase [Gemmatimonadota bacterium]
MDPNDDAPRVERRQRPRSDEPASRRASLGRLTEKPLDLLVIGGGIVGAGIARDAAMRGYRVGLVERGDLGAGTSSRSSRLIHGGLRYLEHGELRLVAEALRERRILLNIAPHLVWPLAFTFPVHKGDRVPRWKLAAGMWLYDLLAFHRRLKRHRTLGRKGVLDAEPMIRDRGLTGGAQYWDAQCDDARLVLATARSAIRHGALLLTYAEVIGLMDEKGRIAGAEVLDRFSTER